MHERIDISNVLLAALFSGLGILFPMLFHLLGLGALFLPMYLPLAAGAFLLNRGNALMMGAFTPLVSTLLTGMPPLYPPVSIAMSIQLGAMCFIISMMTHRGGHFPARTTSFKVVSILITAILIERLLMFLIFNTLMPIAGVNTRLYALYDLARGLPGIILLCLTVPAAVPRIGALLEKHSLRLYEKKTSGKEGERTHHV